MKNFELEGKLIKKYDKQQVTEKFSKREFVIEIPDDSGISNYIDQIKMQLSQERCNLLDSLNVGDSIKTTFRVRGRRWEKDGKESYFVSLDVLRIEKPVTKEYKVVGPETIDEPNVEEDDVPF